MSEDVTVEETDATASDEASPGLGSLAGGEPASTSGPEWMSSLGEEFQGDATLEKFKDVSSLAKGYKELQSYMGNSIKVPSDLDNTEALNDVYNKLGRPEKPDGYVYERPDFIPPVAEGESDTYNVEAQKSFMEAAHAQGFTQKQVKFSLDYFNKMGVDGLRNMEDLKVKNDMEAERQLRDEWTVDYDKNRALAVRGFNAVATDDDKKYIQTTGLDRDPTLLRLFSKVGAKLSEGQFTGDVKRGGIASPETARVEIDAIRNDPSHELYKAYNDGNHPDHSRAVAELSKLYNVLHPEK